MDLQTWAAVLARYGQNVTLRRGDGVRPLRAFFQPVEEKAPGALPTPLGVASRGKYLYLGPAEEPLEGAWLEWEGRLFRLLRERTVFLGEKAFYRWALWEERE